ncbi:MAG: acyloxyacyl hydrolase [Gilvibacter sp.]
MRYFLSCVALLLVFQLAQGQQNNSWKKDASLIMPEVLLGQTFESNDGFPDTSMQYQTIIGFARDNTYNTQEWAYRLKRPITGLSLGFTNFGNLDSLGIALTVMPIIEFKLFKSQRISALVGMGASYFTEQFDAQTNPKNQAVTTDFTWAYRAHFYYNFLNTKNIDWRFGIGYAHHSNGHTRLLNQGFNSALASVSAIIHKPKRDIEPKELSTVKYQRTIYRYISMRYGQGQNVLALSFNDKKSVYSLAGEYGWVYNNTFKFGIGFTYRMYQHYYDYIKDNESLVQDGREFDFFKESPWRYATNFAITINGEFLLNHIGLDLQIGYNFHKPAYQIDWRINEGWDNTPRDIPEDWMLGEFNSKFELKKQIATRMGLKYYLFGTNAAPTHNIFAGAHITANLGQADFTELSIGYVYKLPAKSK